MASAKVPVDHSAVSGIPPKKEEPKPTNGGGFLDSMKGALEGAGVKVEDSAAPPPTAAPARKSILTNIHKGCSFDPPRIMLVGQEGVGKSSWAACAPSPIFIATEDRHSHINCEKFTWPDPSSIDGLRKKASSYQEVVECLTGLATEPHSYLTVVVDSLDWLERLIWTNVARRFGKKSIEDIGYAKGYTHAVTDEWSEIIGLLARCRARGMAIISIAHARVEKFEDPEFPAYDRFVPKLHKHTSALLKEWHDCVFFATYKRTVRMVDGEKKDNSDGRALAVPVGANGGERIIRTVGGPACEAKNSYGLPPEIPLTWPAFAAGFEAFINKSA